MYKLVIKSIIDFSVSLVVLIVLFPILFGVTVLLIIANDGKPFFFQLRPGRNERIFKIIKFKTMNDKRDSKGDLLPDVYRLTKIGQFVRKISLDELPQFLNVLMGQMSLVGPRPEREFFKDQIIERAPIYQRLHRIKPGITSWGQIKYGYASNVEEMIDRMKYDILYLENMSLGLDFKIMLYTVLIMIQGRGK